MRNCLTVDVEEWFHICGVGGPLSRENWNRLPGRVIPNTRELLAILDRRRVRGTFFVLGWIAEQYPELVAEIASAGHEIASHGHFHVPVYDLTPETFADEVDRSLAALAAAGSRHVVGFRAPQWSINDRSLWALEVLAGKGFRFDSSLAPLRIIGNPRYPTTMHTRKTAAGELLEFPPMVDRRFGQNFPLGGGWGLRMTPPERVLKAIETRNREGSAVTLFVHPWEIDRDPPRVRLPWAKRFVHYFRLEGFASRLETILGGCEFAPMGEVLGVHAASA